jgi:hypothetical protein
MCLCWLYITRRKGACFEKSEKSVQNPEKDLRLPCHVVIRQPWKKNSDCLGIPARVVTRTSLPALQSAAQQFAPSLDNCGVTRRSREEGSNLE